MAGKPGVASGLAHTFGRWRIEKKAGEGASGEVFQVEADGTRGALKVLSPGFGFEEASIIAHAAREWGPSLLDVGRTSDGRACVVTSWVDGESVDAARGDERAAWAITHAVARAIEAFSKRSFECSTPGRREARTTSVVASGGGQIAILARRCERSQRGADRSWTCVGMMMKLAAWKDAALRGARNFEVETTVDPSGRLRCCIGGEMMPRSFERFRRAHRAQCASPTRYRRRRRERGISAVGSVGCRSRCAMARARRFERSERERADACR